MSRATDLAPDLPRARSAGTATVAAPGTAPDRATVATTATATAARNGDAAAPGAGALGAPAPGLDGRAPRDDAGAASPAAILDLVARRFRLRARRRALWLRHAWELAAQAAEVPTVDEVEVDGILADVDDPAAEARWLATDPRAAELADAIAEVEDALARDATSPLARLRDVFALGDADTDLLHAAVAVAHDPSLARVCAYLAGSAGRAYLTEPLAARVFGRGRGRFWNAASPLRRWGIVEEAWTGPAEPPALRLDPVVLDWLRGEPVLDPEFAPYAEPLPAREPLSDWPVDATAARVRELLGDPGAVRVRVVVSAPEGWGRRDFAAAVAARLGMPALAVEPARIPTPDRERVRARVERQAYFEGAAPVWCGPGAWHPPAAVTPFPLQFVIVQGDEAVPPEPGWVDVVVSLPDPGVEGRRTLWLAAVPGAHEWPAGEVDRLATRFRVGAGRIREVALARPATPADAAAALRRASGAAIGELARRLECPFGWSDLVVPDRIRAALADLVYEAETRHAFWEDPERRRLFPQGRGLVALFSGAPGTGKTMAAQVVAAELGFDLFRIDLSAVISKYVGETSQNLQRILARAPDDAVLFFDEADALFGKRTEVRDAHDRFANADTGHLLQAIEEYRGVAILATNRKDNIDPAFLRRIRCAIEFPRPDANDRAALWRRFLAALGGGRVVDGKTVAALATLDLTGAQIKSAVLSGALHARRRGEPLSVDHVLTGIDRELMKEGRALSERERERLRHHGRA